RRNRPRGASGRASAPRASRGQRTGWSSLALPGVAAELLDVLLVLGLGLGELRLARLRVDGDEVDPLPGCRVGGGLDGRGARVVDRAGRQSGVGVGVVRTVGLAL